MALRGSVFLLLLSDPVLLLSMVVGGWICCVLLCRRKICKVGKDARGEEHCMRVMSLDLVVGDVCLGCLDNQGRVCCLLHSRVMDCLSVITKYFGAEILRCCGSPVSA